MIYGTGYIPDDADERDREYAVAAEHLPVAAPSSCDLRPLFGKPHNQNGHNSCITQAIAKAVRVAHIQAGHPDPPDLCRFLLWAQLRGELLLDQNVGSQIRKGFKKLNAEGFCQEKHWPHDHDTGPEARFRKKPSRNARRMAHDQREKGANTIYRRIYEGGHDRIERIKGCNANGMLVVFGTDVDHDFTGNHFDPTVALDPPTGNIAGGHAMVVVGYLPGDIFIIGNSYSDRWGDGGFCLFTADYLVSILTRDLWMIEKAPWFSELAA
jgi:hypothetical protein